MDILGLDIGTTTLCGILCDAESGEIRRTVTRPNDAFLPSRCTWEKQQDPHVLIAQVREMADRLCAQGRPAAVGVTGQMHGMVYLTREGRPAGPLTIWQDGRGDQPYREGETYAGFLSRITGYPLATGYGAVTHFYNTVNGLVPEEAVTFCTIHDLAVMALTGRTQPWLHPSDAASFGLYCLESGGFDAAAIEAAGMDPAFFPPVADGFALAGRTPTGIPVAVAIGDNQASVLGSVSDLENSLLVNVGTGSQISCVVPKAYVHSGLDCRPLTQERWLLAGSSLCGGRAYAILEHFLREAAVLVGGRPVDSAYPAMDRLMADFASPAQPLLVDTAFSGTRQQPERRGRISGIGVDNLTVAHLCDGVMNGMVSELYGMYEDMRPFLAQPPTRLIGSGNGLRFNAPLAERFSAAFGLPLSIPVHREEAAFGAALFAMTAAGLVPTLKEAQTRIHYKEKEEV